MAADITKGYAELLGRCFHIRTIHLCLISHPPSLVIAQGLQNISFLAELPPDFSRVKKYDFIDFNAKMLL